MATRAAYQGLIQWAQGVIDQVNTGNLNNASVQYSYFNSQGGPAASFNFTSPGIGNWLQMLSGAFNAWAQGGPVQPVMQALTGLILTAQRMMARAGAPTQLPHPHYMPPPPPPRPVPLPPARPRAMPAPPPPPHYNPPPPPPSYAGPGQPTSHDWEFARALLAGDVSAAQYMQRQQGRAQNGNANSQAFLQRMNVAINAIKSNTPIQQLVGRFPGT